MPNLDITQTPNPAPVDTPSIVTQLDTQTGPEASPTSFGPNLEGLAQGADSANQDLQTTLYHARWEQRETQAAQNKLASLSAYTDLDKQFTSQRLTALAAGQTIDPDKFDSDFQTALAKKADSMPNLEARAALMSDGSSLGLGFYKSNLGIVAEANQRARDAQVANVASSLVNQVKTGSITLDQGQDGLQKLGPAIAPASGGAPGILNQANADMVHGAVTNIAQTHGPAVAALAVRNGIGGDAIQEPHKEILATQFDNQQVIANVARARVAQQNVDALAQKAAAGGFVSNADTAAAANELHDATAAKPVETNAPDLTDYIQSRYDHLSALANSFTGRNSTILYKAAEQMELANDGKLIEQRLNVMSPTDQRLQVDKMADVFGPDDPLVRHAATIAQGNIARLTPGPNYDPAAVAMQNPSVQASLAAAEQFAHNPFASGEGPISQAQIQGQAQGLLKTAIEKSFAAQGLLGVPAGQERVLTKQQAESHGAAADKPVDAQKLVNTFQQQYGPDYASRALQQVFTNKGKMSGSVSLALMNPNSQPLWAAAQFPAEKLKENDPNEAAITSQISKNQAWNNYWLAQKNDLSAATRRQGMEQAMPGMAQYFMKQNNMSASDAVDHVIDLSIGNAYSIGEAGNGNKIAFPSNVVGPGEVDSTVTKATLAMNSLIRQHGIMDVGGQLDGEHLTLLGIDNGYWNYDNKTGAVVRMYDNALGPKVVTLGNGQPLFLDAKQLKNMNLVTQTAPVIKALSETVQKGPETMMGDLKAGAGFVYHLGVRKNDYYAPPALGSDPNQLLVQPQAKPDQSPVLTAPEKEIPIAPIANKKDFDQAGLEGKLPQNMKGLGPVFEKYASQYNLDPNLLAAISMHETGRGTSRAFLEGNNAMGVSNSAGPIAFDNVEDSIAHQAHTIGTSPLYAKFRKTGRISDLGETYAPVGAENDPRGLNSDWTGGVSKFYDELTDDNG